MSSSTGAAGRGAAQPAALLTATRAFLAAALVAAVALLPDHVLVGWIVFGSAAAVAAVVGVWIHPRVNRTVLWWGAGAFACLLAAQICGLVGGSPARSGGAALFDLFDLAAGVAASGALLSTMSRRVPGWDVGFLLDLIIVVAGVGVVVWQYVIDPYIVPGTPSTLLHLTLAAYPTVCLVLAMLTIMLVVRVGWRRRGVALLVFAIAGMIFSNLCLLAARIDDGAARGFWSNAAWRDSAGSCSRDAGRSHRCTFPTRGVRAPRAAGRAARSRSDGSCCCSAWRWSIRSPSTSRPRRAA